MRKLTNFDHPDAFEWRLLAHQIEELKSGRAIEQPTYSYITCTRLQETVHVEPKDVIIVEGIMTLYDKSLREQMDLKIFVDAEPDERLLRVIQRDMAERGHPLEMLIGKYRNILKPMHDEFIEPTKQFADIIIPNGGNNERAIAIFKKKGIQVSSFNPADLEAKKAEKKMAQEIEDAKRGVEQPMTEEDIIKKFNQLLTVEDDNGLKPEYDNRTRGRIQNQNVDIEPMPMFFLTYYNIVNKLNGKTHYMKEMTEVNDSRLLSKMLVLSADVVQLDSTTINKHFESIDYYNGMLAVSKPRSVDYFGRAMDYMMVKDYERAIADIDRAIGLSPKFTLAYFLRANAYYMQYQLEKRDVQNSAQAATSDAAAAAKLLAHSTSDSKLSAALDDYNEVLKLSPKSVYALYNRGFIYMLMGDYTSAIGSFNEAIAIKPDLGEAFYNRGLMYFKLGNREKGVADLSNAGELGVLPSYNVLKRMSY